MKFSYKKFPSGFFRPIIPLEVGHGDQSLAYHALIDSGADFNIFHAEIGELIGLDVPTGTEILIGGITEGERQLGYIHRVTIKLGGVKFATEVIFMPTLSKLGHGLLGQSGFFDLFKSVNFDFHKKDIELKPKL